MNNIIEAIKSIISPEQSWSAFVMKITSLIIVAIIGYIGFQQYLNLGVEEDNEIPIIEVYEKDPRDAVLQLTERLKIELEKRIVIIEDVQLERIIQQVETLYRSKLREENTTESKGTQDFHWSQDIVRAVEYFAKHEPKTVKTFERKITHYLTELERLDYETPKLDPPQFL